METNLRSEITLLHNQIKLIKGELGVATTELRASMAKSMTLDKHLTSIDGNNTAIIQVTKIAELEVTNKRLEIK